MAADIQAAIFVKNISDEISDQIEIKGHVHIMTVEKRRI